MFTIYKENIELNRAIIVWLFIVFTKKLQISFLSIFFVFLMEYYIKFSFKEYIKQNGE